MMILSKVPISSILHLVIRLALYISRYSYTNCSCAFHYCSYVLNHFPFWLVKDELLWAATWLYRATNEEYYLKYVVDNAVYMGGTGWAVKEFSWDNKYAGVQILLSKVMLN